MPCILALDQGTSSSRAIVFDATGEALASAQLEFRQSYPEPGRVEHDPVEIWHTQLACAREALARAGLAAADVAAIGIANQRETTVLWDRSTGARWPRPSSGRTAAPSSTATHCAPPATPG
jgi:glycerol kinase